MKILHIIDSGGMYGAEIVLLELIKEQIKQGLRPVIASIGDKKSNEKPFETAAIENGFVVKKFRMIAGPNILGAFRILKFAKEQNFNLLHSHGYKGNILLGFIPQKNRNLPMLSTLHGYTSTSGLSKMRIYEWLDLLSHKFIDQVVLVNKGMLSNPKLKNRKGINYHIINNGISITNSPPELNRLIAERIKNFSQNSFTIGSIGRFSDEKGYKYLIESLSQLIQKKKDARLIIIGDGDQFNMLNELARELGVSDKILFLGYIKNAGDYIRLFDVYAISSLTEGLPITLLEAMQAKTPVVATSVGGVPEVIDNEVTGLLVPPCHPDAMINAFIRLYEDPAFAKKLAARAYQQLRDNYSSEHMAQRYSDMYKIISRTA